MPPLRPLSLALALLTLLAGSAAAETIRVPKDQPTIQAAVDAAGNDDVVLVSGGSYAEDVLVEHKHGLRIAAKGKVVISGAPGQPPGLAVEDCSGVVLDGLRFTGFDVAVDVRDCVGVVLRGLRVTDSTYGLRLTDVLGGLVEDCRVDSEGFVNVDLDETRQVVVRGLRSTLAESGTHVRIDETQGVTVRDCKLRGGATAVRTSEGMRRVHIEGNDIRDTSFFSLYLFGDDFVVRGNTLRNVGTAVFIAAGGTQENFEIVDNAVWKTTGTAFDLGCEASRVSGNLIVQAGGDGIVLEEPDVVVTDNQVVKAAGVGLWVQAAPATLIGNRVKQSGDDDLLVEETAIASGEVVLVDNAPETPWGL